MKDMNFIKCTSDECLLMRGNSVGSMVICVYIDDTLCIGHIEALNFLKDELKNHFATKEEEGKLEEYVGCQIKKLNNQCIIMYQTELLKKNERIFWTL